MNEQNLDDLKMEAWDLENAQGYASEEIQFARRALRMELDALQSDQALERDELSVRHSSIFEGYQIAGEAKIEDLQMISADIQRQLDDLYDEISLARKAGSADA